MSMKQYAFSMSSVAEEEQYTALQDLLAEQLSPTDVKREAPYNALGFSQLATQCLKEIDNYRRGEPCTDAYGLELLRRAIIQSDQEAGCGCNTASVGWYEAGCDVILRERWRVAWRARRTM
jgi:hypothetical protein